METNALTAPTCDACRNSIKFTMFYTIFTYFSQKKNQRCKSLIPQQCNCYIDTFVRLMYNHGPSKIDESNLLKPSISPGQISTNPWHNTEFDLMFRARWFFLFHPLWFLSQWQYLSGHAGRLLVLAGLYFPKPNTTMPKPGMSGAAQPNSNPKSNPVGRKRWRIWKFSHLRIAFECKLERNCLTTWQRN